MKIRYMIVDSVIADQDWPKYPIPRIGETIVIQTQTKKVVNITYVYVNNSTLIIVNLK